MGDGIKIPLEVCCFLAELFKMQENTTRGEQELADSTKERNAAHKMTRLVDKGAQKHSESQAVTNLFNQLMIKSTCLLDFRIHVKNPSLPV